MLVGRAFASSLEARMAAIAAFGLLVFSLIAGLLTYAQAYQRQLETATSLQQQLFHTIQAQAEIAAFISNQEIADGVIHGLLANPIVLGVRIESLEVSRLKPAIRRSGLPAAVPSTPSCRQWIARNRLVAW